MEKDLIAERVRTVYQKDLYGDYFTMRARLETDDFEHGDTIRVSVREGGIRDSNKDRGKPWGQWWSE